MSAPNPTEEQELPFGTIANKRTSLVFDQPDVSSDGGAILIKQQADKSDLFAKLAGAIHDGRNQPQVVHAIETLIAQRVTGLCLGYEDANTGRTAIIAGKRFWITARTTMWST
jgi:hypothetical protein